MTKPRGILKGKVKRLLREQEDMGQLCDPAVDHCVFALEAFVHDIGRRLKSHAESTGVHVVTPIELKRCVLASEDLAFLHGKVQTIDESDAKYHKPQSAPRKRKADPAASATDKPQQNTKSKRTAATATATASNKGKANTTCTGSTKAAGTTLQVEGKGRKGRAAKTATATSVVEAPVSAEATATTTTVVAIEEDDNYDSSDSD